MFHVSQVLCCGLQFWPEVFTTFILGHGLQFWPKVFTTYTGVALMGQRTEATLGIVEFRHYGMGEICEVLVLG